MAKPHPPTPAKPKTLVPSNGTLTRVVPIRGAAELENMIRERAYQLYEGRGCEPGQDQQDWVQAEHEILNPQP
jgi:hypothetical protein